MPVSSAPTELTSVTTAEPIDTAQIRDSIERTSETNADHIYRPEKVARRRKHVNFKEPNASNAAAVHIRFLLISNYLQSLT